MKRYAFQATTVAIIIVLILQTGSVNYDMGSFVKAETQEEPGAAQKVVNYYREVFEFDWKIGRTFDSSVDGMGLAASRDIKASPNFVKKHGISRTICPLRFSHRIIPETLIVDLINRANSSLFIMQMYFNPGLIPLKARSFKPEVSRRECIFYY